MPRRAPAGSARKRWVRVGSHRVAVTKSGRGFDIVDVQHPKGERGGCAFEGGLDGFELFHDRSARGVKHGRIGPIPDVMYQLGELGAVQYISDKWDGRRRKYLHHFTAPRPLLCGDHRGRLWILGGRYRVTAEGIEG